ncbi:CDP-glycerol glycerophosphotransferase family protein [Cytobacillus gottheilii]|uniref:CDP-glycerol glycerophosphotransferase family protein n=1 Tax=Cytobacillus gottheilii TaxID=859144 RepID=UPI003CE8AA4D
MKIIIFGTGSCCIETLTKIDHNKVEIIGFMDNDKQKQHRTFNGKYVYNPESITSLNYDLILIASEYSAEIINQLLDMKVDIRKVIPVLHPQFTKQLDEKYKEKLKDVQKVDYINPRLKKKVALLNLNNSGSNTFALYKNMPKSIEEKYDVQLINKEELRDDSDFDLICSTSIFSVYKPSIINVQLWHGFPLKKIGTRTDLFFNSYSEDVKVNTDKIISYSETYSTLFNASFPNSPNKYEICGMPRNDFLFDKNPALMKEIFGENIFAKKIIMYLPTYRKWKVDMRENGDRNWNNFFGFKKFSNDNFVSYLRKNNLYFICKLHHMEYNQLDINLYKDCSDVIKFIEDDELENRNIDLYEIIANIDLLITDYSSVYFDLLLTNIPLIFTPVDIDFYQNNRGFNLEPYDFWTPGPKVFNQEGLLTEIEKALNHDSYKDIRGVLTNIVHQFKDNHSSERVWTLLDTLLKGKS